MTFQHIYLSPHLDDAVLSCGGLILRQVAGGEQVLLVNVFAGIPDYSRLSPFTQELHATWGDSPDPVASRRAEDEAVLAGLGVSFVHWNYLDCIYRSQGDQWFYPSRDALFGSVHPAESGLLWHVALDLAQLHREHEDAIFFAPLGAGHHVDHQIVRAGAVGLNRLGADVAFYEDFPYAGEADALEKAMAELGNAMWETVVVPIDVEAKIRAIAGYTSQIPILFGDASQMADRVRSYAQSAPDEGVDYGERLWRML